MFFLSCFPPLGSPRPLSHSLAQVGVYTSLCCCRCCVVTKLCPTLCNPLECSPLRSSVHGISQAIILEWIAISFFRGSSQPRDETRVSCIGRRIIHHCATWKAHINCTYILFPQLDGHSLKGRAESVQFSSSVVSDYLRPHESQHTRPPCPSPTPRVHSELVAYISLCYIALNKYLLIE